MENYEISLRIFYFSCSVKKKSYEARSGDRAVYKMSPNQDMCFPGNARHIRTVRHGFVIKKYSLEQSFIKI